MAKAFCISVELANKLKAAARAGEIDIAKMYNMNSEKRRALFEKYVDKGTAKEINTGFETAMISTQKTALKKWAESVFTASEKKTAKYKDVLSKIDELDKTGLLTPNSENGYLEDLVSSKLGATVTSEEAAKISKLSKRLQETASERTQFNTQTLEYFQARKEMDDYIDSITPSSQLKVASSVIARGTLLASFKSPLLNIESNTIQGLNQAFARRLENRKLGGVNNSYATKYALFVQKVFSKTGYDISRMVTLDTERTLHGEERVTTQGPGATRKVARIYEDLIFKRLLSGPDTFFASIAFADRANIESTKIAQSQGLKGKALQEKALTIFKDATSLEPKTPEGEAVRSSAIADAMYTTYTNKSAYSDIALGIRNLLNAASKDARLGDQLMPFVKTPANVIGAGIDSTGILLPPKTLLRMIKTMNDIKSGESVGSAFGNNFRGMTKDVVRAGLGITFAFMLSSLFNPEDYIGEYPVTEKERKLLELKRATTNSVKIGNKWISVDYFGPLGAPFIGLMYAKKYGKDLPTGIWEYYKGVGRQAAKIPGFEQLYDTVELLRQGTPGAGKSLNDEMRDVGNFVLSFVRARTIPSLIGDIAKGTDTVDRKVDSKDAVAGFKSGIPGMRQQLPEKRDVFGTAISTEGIMSVLAFGSRVKTASNDPVVKELSRLEQVGQLPSITDVEKTSDRAKQLKVQIGDDKFQRAKQEYGKSMKTKFEQTMKSNSYKKASDDEKKTSLQKIKDDEFDRMLKRYGYKKPKK